MRSRIGIGALASALVVTAHVRAQPPAALPEDPAISERLLKIAGEGFRIRDTSHFTIAYDTDPAVLGALVGRLEGTYLAVWNYCEAMRFPLRPPPHRLEVILFDQYDDYLRYGAGIGIDVRAGVAGFYNQENRVAAFCNIYQQPGFAEINRQIEQLQEMIKRPNGRGAERGRLDSQQRNELLRQVNSLRAQRDAAVERFNRMILQHEAAHQILFNAGVHVARAQTPGWLAEGLACQFEVRQGQADRGAVQINHTRLADFRDAFDVPVEARTANPASMRRAFEDGRFVPLERLVSQADLFASRDANTLYLYAEAWGLVYYLARERPDALAQYVRGVAGREAGVELSAQQERAAFTAAFGPLDAALEEAFVSYVLALPFSRSEANP